MVSVPLEHMMIMPVKVVIEPRANRKRGAKSAAETPLIIDILRLIDRHINDVWIRGQDFDLTVIIHHLRLRRRNQVAVVLGGNAQALDRIHHCLLLVQKRLPEFDGPIQVIVHVTEDRRITRERLHAGIPRLLVYGIGVAPA